MIAEGDEPTVKVVAAVVKSPVAVADDKPPVKIATGAAQSPVAAAAATPFAASTTTVMTERDELYCYVSGNCKQKKEP